MLTTVDWPYSRSYKSGSENEPVEFYLTAFSQAKSADLLLGYFSFSAINVLSVGFAQFLANGGNMRVVANNILSKKDKETILKAEEPGPNEGLIDLENLGNLRYMLDDYGKHFFECMAWLIKNKRVEIVLIKPKGTSGISHYKEGLFDDGENQVMFSGSCNFTAYGMVENLERLDAFLSWENSRSSKKIADFKNDFNNLFSGKDENVDYIPVAEVEEAIINEYGSKDLQQLLTSEKDLLRMRQKLTGSTRLKKLLQVTEERLEDLASKPRFPYTSGPREYQKDAYLAWVNNGKSGVFAMATGTGKTITSLNCLLKEYQERQSYHAIILVPSIALLNQWEQEVLQFQFKSILKVGGGNNWESSLSNYASNFSWGIKDNLVIISTYGSFVLDRFQRIFKKLQNDFMLIADEAHNMGARNIKSKIKDISINRKIALSATPKRIYDPEGTAAIDYFFKDKPPYTYSFDMEKAMEFGFLTNYKYYPIVVELNEAEFDAYREISQQLLKYFDFKEGKFRDEPMVEILLLKRKNIIHKAENKKDAFIEILKELHVRKKDKFIFTYVAEGESENEDGDNQRIIDQFLIAAHESFPNLKMNTYTSHDQDLKDILKGFSQGKIDLLFAMKMLDEGVDIPRAEIGIFASSTGNPRQFIQRRGRLLRKHPDKKEATIYDMIVIPSLNNLSQEFFAIEKNLVRNELNRVGYFASLALNFYDTKDTLESICNKYQLDLNTIISEL